jgi:LPS export ABC transporter protein LptC
LIRILLSILVIALLTLAGCANEKTPGNVPASSVNTSARPDTEVIGARIHLYEGSRVTTEVQADRIRRFEAIDSTAAYTVSVDFLDSTGQVSSNVVGDSAVIRENTGHLQIFGHVVVHTRENSVLETDYLIWNPDINKIQTDAFVKITRKSKDVITGWGLEADKNLTHLKILRQVSGTVTSDEADGESQE